MHRQAWEEVNTEEQTDGTKGGGKVNGKVHRALEEAQVRRPALQRKELTSGSRMGGKQAKRKI